MKHVKYNWHLFLTAIMFLTRLPMPKNIPHSNELLQGSSRYFSWVGIFIGLCGGLVLAGLGYFFSPALSIIGSMIATLLLTGAFHEDGLADCFDAFGGGWSKEKILTIMKDSRLGTFGVVGLVMALALKFSLLLELSSYFPIYVVAFLLLPAHALSRLLAVTVMQQLSYVQDIDLSKSKPLANRKLTQKEIVIATLGAAIPLTALLILLPQPNFYLNPGTVLQIPKRLILLLLPALVLRYFAVRFFKKWIGGYTGDCLGATQQICELGFYLGCLLLWRSI